MGPFVQNKRALKANMTRINCMFMDTNSPSSGLNNLGGLSVFKNKKIALHHQDKTVQKSIEMIGGP
jgi:hypothetical protein